ncbi:DUF4328 domain-containing protein [uncultured Erythrobacter sp.]|uniref:DUF4328 domain-containing protein n=1 Tax=uncultured Erythrobacter sp. TaxID=263913 RepID=UPI00262F1F6A|nr:DUF4328 domain-containing protein [uncultured Erythrobacter sp.]
MEIDFRQGLERGSRIGDVAQVMASLVAGSSTLCAIGVALFLNGLWPEALAGSYELHGLDALVLIDVLLLIVSFFVIGAWIWRAHANLSLTDAPQTEYTPGWAVGWFAVPIANLFKPFQAMKALWQASHGEEPDANNPAGGLLWVWWIGWLVSSIGGFGEVFTTLNIVAYVATVVSAICMLLIIRRINAAQPTMSIARTFE